jgi:hypothetical protein
MRTRGRRAASRRYATAQPEPQIPCLMVLAAAIPAVVAIVAIHIRD